MRGAEERLRRSPTTVEDAQTSWSAFWRGHGGAAIALFLFALAVRASVLVQLGQTPLFEVRYIDSQAYHRWALRIVEGHWLPAGSFYQSPFYAYYLAVLYALFGVGEWVPRISQVILGSLSPALIYAIGARLFSRRVGWIAGVGLALYGPIVLEEVTFSKTSLLVVTAVSGLALYLWEAPRGRVLGMLGAGLLLGTSVVGVGQWLLVFVALVTWAPMMAEDLPPSVRRRAAAAFAVGGLAVILPVVAWNSANGGGLLLTSGDAGLNFYNGNNRLASGLGARPPEVRDVPEYEEADARRLAERATGAALTPSGVSRYWMGQGLRWIAAHPTRWLAVVGQKLLTLWNGYEIPDNYHYAFTRAHFVPLLWPLVTFSLVAPLALVGLATPFWRRRDVTALYIVCGIYLLTVVMFYVRGRYRLPAVPFLLVFAGATVSRLVDALGARRWRSAAALCGALLLATVVTNREHCEAARDTIVPAVCLGGETWFDYEWLKLSAWSLEKGDLDQAMVYAKRASESTRQRSPGRIAARVAEIEARRTIQLLRAGRRDEAMVHFGRAETHYQTALRLVDRPGGLQTEVGILYAIVGKPMQAVAAFEAAAATGDTDAAALPYLARAYVELGRCADAERVLAGRDTSNETRAILGACGGSPR